MFNDRYGLTKAVLEGRKTMTRRIAYTGEVVRPNSGHLTEGKERGTCVLCDGNRIIAKSYYKVGEVVAIAQRYKELLEECGGRISPFVAKAGYMNKMFVRADLMPHRIHITNIYVGRLQNISDEDCKKEGIDYIGGYSESYYFGHGVGNIRLGNSPREAFAGLIDKVSGKGTWASNPWVFVYEFELVK